MELYYIPSWEIKSPLLLSYTFVCVTLSYYYAYTQILFVLEEVTPTLELGMCIEVINFVIGMYKRILRFQVDI